MEFLLFTYQEVYRVEERNGIVRGIERIENLIMIIFTRYTLLGLAELFIELTCKYCLNEYYLASYIMNKNLIKVFADNTFFLST